MNLKYLSLLAPLLLSACQTALTAQSSVQAPVKDCHYLMRDLTLPWQQRHYWCVPHDYLGRVRIARPAESTTRPALTAANAHLRFSRR